MTEVTFHSEGSRISGFEVRGHSGYAPEGEDIVCAAVSALVINALNSIEEFTEDAFTCDCQDGQIQNWEFTSEVSPESELLMDSLMLGLQNISTSYGEEYLKIL